MVRNVIETPHLFPAYRYVDCWSIVAGYWLAAKVLSCQSDCVCVHFVGWSSKYDETIPSSSGRLAVRGTKVPLPVRPKRKVVPAGQSTAVHPPIARQKVRLDTCTADLSDNGEIAEEGGVGNSGDHTVSTPVGVIALGDCLVLKPSNRGATDELCTVSSISHNAVEVKCSWTGRTKTINVKDLTTARVTTFTTPDKPSTHESSDKVDKTSGLFLAQEWSDLVPTRQYLPTCQYARDAERLIAEVNANNPPKKGVTYGTSTLHTESAVNCCTPRHFVCLTYLYACSSAESVYKSITPPKAIKEALSNPARLGTLVGIGEITDSCDIIFHSASASHLLPMNES
eukprot:COSAG02_NODE_1293_length_13410_cov_13.392004_10_plen_341_part_00